MQQGSTVVKKKLYHVGIIASFMLLLGAAPVAADSGQRTEDRQERARVGTARTSNESSTQQRDSVDTSSLPITLSDGTTIDIIVPTAWRGLGLQIATLIDTTRSYLGNRFGELPRFHTTVRLLEEESFFRATGAPRWTNALYYRGQIIVPLSPENVNDEENLRRSIRHEYTHAALHALSGGRCPGWLDEGIAQALEGSENPALAPALSSWLGQNSPVPLTRLQLGFTRLDRAMVPAAYAQSLYAATTIRQAFGYRSIRAFLEELRSGNDQAQAFRRSFGISESSFEEALGRSLKTWSSQVRSVNHKAGPANLEISDPVRVSGIEIN